MTGQRGQLLSRRREGAMMAAWRLSRILLACLALVCLVAGQSGPVREVADFGLRSSNSMTVGMSLVRTGMDFGHFHWWLGPIS